MDIWRSNSRRSYKRFWGAILFSSEPYKTAELLDHVLGLERIGEEGEFIRFRSTAHIGNIIDVKVSPTGKGQMGVGTVHHIAWRANDDKDHLEWQQHVTENGYQVTSVRDRNYFKALYFREHGDILFEIATDPPGFAHDESEATMGKHLKLPKQYEHHREKLEDKLIPIQIRELD